MKKSFILILVFVLALVVFSAVSCGASQGNDEGGGTVTEDGKPKDPEKAPFTMDNASYSEIKDLESLPEDIRDFVESMKSKKGFAFFESDGGCVVFICMGQKNTGGYAVRVKSLESAGDATKIIVEEKVPSQGDIVTPAIMYPYTIIKISGSPRNFKVFDEAGEEYENLSESGDNGKIEMVKAEGVYTGEIDGSSVEIRVNGTPMAFRYKENLSSVIASLNEDDRVRLTYYKNEYGQLILTELSK